MCPRQLRWTYGFELIIQITKELNGIPKIQELPDDIKLIVVVEGKSPTCYGCDQKGHIKRIGP